MSIIHQYPSSQKIPIWGQSLNVNTSSQEQFTWQHKHMSNFEPSYHSSTRRALGDQWFSKHLQLDQNTSEHRKKGKESRKVGRVWLTSLDLKPLELLICNKKNDVPGSKSKPVWPKSFIECKKALMFPHL